MNPITITIAAPDLAAAINNLADALRGAQAQQTPPAAPTQPVAPMQPVAPVQPVAPMQPVAPVAPPLQPVAPAAPTVTPPEYTLEQLTLAATPFIDAGRSAELVALLAQFHIQALTQLPKEHYGAFATALRGMGAKI